MVSIMGQNRGLGPGYIEGVEGVLENVKKLEQL